MYRAIVSVRPDENFSLTVVFDDGAEGILDMKPYLDFGVFRKLKDREAFKRARVAFDTVEWECGVDLDPEFVNKNCRIVKTA